jgi:hypothetical protein
MKDKYIQTLLRFNSAWKGHGLLAMKIVETFKPKTIVDLGVDWGFSTFCFAYPQIGQVYGIDWFEGDEHAGFRDTSDDVNILYKDLNVEYGINNVTFIKADFNDAAKTWDKEIDILHIDGFHSYEAVKNDYETWFKFCKEDSIILFHDVEAYRETVGVFFNELDGYTLIHSGSAGLGILTKSEEVYNKLQKICVSDQ